MKRLIKVIVRPHEPLLLSVCRDVFSFACLLSLFFFNHWYLGGHWAVYLFGGVLILLTIISKSSVLETAGSGLFTSVPDAIAFLEKFDKSEGAADADTV